MKQSCIADQLRREGDGDSNANANANAKNVSSICINDME